MSHITDIKISRKSSLLGRGTILETPLEFDIAVHKIKLGDTIGYEGKFYEITGYGAMLKTISEKEKMDFLVLTVKEIIEQEKIEKEFVSILWEMPQHWFSEINGGVRVMAPISYALYQTFCLRFGYEMGVFDLAPQDDRKYTFVNGKGKDEIHEFMWGNHPDDWKIMLPLFNREKEKYLQLVNTKTKLFKNKSILGMIHLSFDQANDGVIERAIREVKVLEEEGVHGIIVENYHGSVDDMKDFFTAAKSILQNSNLVVGLNILPNEYESALELANEVGAKFIQLDYVAGVYNNRKAFIDEAHYMYYRSKYPHIVVLGGVWPKYYVPDKNSDLKLDIKNGMYRADAIVVTGAGTGKETPIEKLEEFRKLTKGFPLFVGAGLTADNASEQLKIADGAIVGSCFKPSGMTNREISRDLVKKFMSALK